jgi:hypothetical protein
MRSAFPASTETGQAPSLSRNCEQGNGQHYRASSELSEDPLALDSPGMRSSASLSMTIRIYAFTEWNNYALVRERNIQTGCELYVVPLNSRRTQRNSWRVGDKNVPE